eukprot:c24206_g2_i1 orf=683-1057(+)
MLTLQNAFARENVGPFLGCTLQPDCETLLTSGKAEDTMDVAKMKAQMIEFRNSLFQEGFVDDQFIQLQQLQDDSNPDFVTEVVGLFFEDSERLLEELAKALEQEPPDFKLIDAFVHQLKGSSSR